MIAPVNKKKYCNSYIKFVYFASAFFGMVAWKGSNKKARKNVVF